MKKCFKKIMSATLCLICVFTVLCSSSEAFIINAANVDEVIVGGVPFGVKFYSEGLVVVGFCEVPTESGAVNPAYDAGLRVNDKITHVNGAPVKTSEELASRIECTPNEIVITYTRGNVSGTAILSPAVSIEDGRRRTGMWVRDTTAGIGTVTFVDPDSGMFAGLGHGICDSETGELLKMERGVVVDVKISGIEKGVSGTPGELKGYFTSEKSGVLLKNTACGVFGVFSEISDELKDNPHLEVADRADVKTGEASIICTLEDGEAAEYAIVIKEINENSRDNRSFLIEVTDKTLLEKTGGIVQGMSGSPIIQNGKLIGAVTHVLVNNPARGYGIFIDNMLDAAG